MVDRRTLSHLLNVYAAHGVNFIVPLATIPFLLRRLGVEQYGWLAVVSTVTQYLCLLTDYSFAVTTPRDISRLRGTPIELRKYVGRFYGARFFLAVLSASMVLLLVVLVPTLREHWSLFIAAFPGVIGYAAMPTPVWYGLEEFVIASRVLIALRMFPAVFIFLLIRSPQDTILILISQSSVILFFGVLSFVLLRFRLGGAFEIPSLTEVFREVRQGVMVFFSTAAISVYGMSGTIVLGMFSTAQIAGCYNAAEKIVRALLVALNPMFQVYYPRIAREPKERIRISNPAVNAPLKLAIPLAVGASSMLALSSYHIAFALLGTDSAETALALRWLSPLPMIVALTYMFNDTIRLSLNLEHHRARTLVSGAALYVLTTGILVAWLHRGIEGVAISVLLTELFILGSAVMSYVGETRRT